MGNDDRHFICVVSCKCHKGTKVSCSGSTDEEVEGINDLFKAAIISGSEGFQPDMSDSIFASAKDNL